MRPVLCQLWDLPTSYLGSTSKLTGEIDNIKAWKPGAQTMLSQVVSTETIILIDALHGRKIFLNIILGSNEHGQHMFYVAEDLSKIL